MTMLRVSQDCLCNCTYMQHAANCMAKCVHPNTVVKKIVLYLSGTDSTCMT